MLGRERFVVLQHGEVDIERWRLKHGVEEFDVDCPACGKPTRTTLPFLVTMDDGRKVGGFITPRCECGTEDRPYCFAAAVFGIE